MVLSIFVFFITSFQYPLLRNGIDGRQTTFSGRSGQTSVQETDEPISDHSASRVILANNALGIFHDGRLEYVPPYQHGTDQAQVW